MQQNTTFPQSTEILIIGAGIHGLSTAYHLAKLGYKDICIVDKEDIGAGASGIACGVIRNNYFQPAMRKLMAHSVNIWESDPKAYSYNPVGYMQISMESMREDVKSIAQQQQAIGYESVFVEGQQESRDYMLELFSDWRAEGITSVLHEKKGGYANNMKSLQGLAQKAINGGVKIIPQVTVKGIEFNQDGSVQAVITDKGNIECQKLVVGVGPWIKSIWDMLKQPEQIEVKINNKIYTKNMWTYWSLQEGTLGVSPDFMYTNNKQMPPVIHVDSDQPLYSVKDGRLITDQKWGIYYKPDFCFDGVQGGAAPFIIDKSADQISVDPYGAKSKDFIVGKDFAEMWVSALSFCQSRFEDKLPMYKQHEPSGGIGCFTPDSFPVFDQVCNNAYIIADSNHGYKMIGVGALVADEIHTQKENDLLKPFRISRYAKGELHPVSNSPYPWS